MALRGDQGHLEELEQELQRAEVVAAGDASVIYTIVFPVEADIATKRISVLAPVGTVLIGYRAGDAIEWATPVGTRRPRIEAVLFQPEAAAGERWEASVAHDSRRASGSLWSR